MEVVMKVLLIPALVILGLFAGSGSALAAATVTTPFVLADVAGICAVTNVAKKPAIVTVRMLASDAGVFATNPDLCSPAPLGPGQSCLVIAAIPSETPVKGFGCSVVSTTSKIRVVAYGNSANGVVVTVPGTAK
jgi:hypothetical protein